MPLPKGFSMPSFRPFLLTALPALLSLATCSGLASAGKYNQKLDIGDAAPRWEPLPATDAKRYAAADLQGEKATVVIFTCNSCPYAQDVESRLVALHEKYKDRGVRLVAINRIEEDRLPAMREKAEQANFRFPYLFDESQQIARQFGAIYTPEFYVLDEDWRVAYMGSLDDSPNGKNVTKRYVETAIEAVLQGQQPAVTETVPIGCGVRYERQRGRRRSRENR
jgi:peroxiredoxin